MKCYPNGVVNIDRLIAQVDRALRTVNDVAEASRDSPAEALPEAELSEQDRRHAAALMRVNHVGEVCAQALYQGQALTARDAHARQALERAALEEEDHLAWSVRRVQELGGRTSLLNPLWYAGAFAIGTVAGALGDRWNLGFSPRPSARSKSTFQGISNACLRRMRALAHWSRRCGRMRRGIATPRCDSERQSCRNRSGSRCASPRGS